MRLSNSARALDVGAPFGVLPTPVLNGNTATYPDVLAGVDLRLTADVEGYTEVLIVKDRTAASNPALAKVTFPVSGAGLAPMVDGDGNVRVVDDAGATVFGGAMPRMWDTADELMETTDPGLIDRIGRRPQATLTAEVATASGAKLAAGVAGAPGAVYKLSVVPDQAYLADPATVYPVMIDPPQTNYKLNWTYVSADCGSCTFWNSSDYAHTGPIDGHTHRSFFMMSMSGLQYRNIISASFVIDLVWTASSYWKETALYDVGSIFSWTSWNAQPAQHTYLGQVVFNAPANGVTWDITSQLQYASSHAWSDETVGMYSISDTDWAYGKQWSNNPAMVVVWNDWPYTPTPQTLYSTDCYNACNSPAVVRTATPKLRAQLSDPNDDRVRADFEVRDGASDTATLLASTTTSLVPSGTVQDWQVPGGVLANGSTSYWRARTHDEFEWLSGWTAWQTLTVDLSPPSSPSSTSTQYPQNAWGAVVGTAGTFNLSDSSADTSEFEWWVDAGSHTTTFATGTSPRTATVSYTPNKDLTHTLHVKAKDNAGNVGGTYNYSFWVSPVANRCWRWQLNETSGTTAADTGNTDSTDPVCGPIGSTITAQPGTLSGVTWTTDAAGAPRDHFATFGGSGQITMPGPVLDTTKSFTVMAWVRASDLSAANGYETILSQDGTTMSRFMLRYDKDANSGAGGWCFEMRASDTTGAAITYACATGTVGDSTPPAVGAWVHLAGVYDAASQQIQVHVMGNQDACNGEMVTAGFTSTWTGSGALVMGRALTTTPALYWHGDIDNVYVFQRALAPSEICQQVL